MKDRSAKGLEVVPVTVTENTSGWHALDYKVIVKKDEVKETYGESGLVLVADVRETEEWTVDTGVVVSVGEFAFTQGMVNGRPKHWESRPGIGQRVMIQNYAGQRFIGADGEKYLILTDKEIACWGES